MRLRLDLRLATLRMEGHSRTERRESILNRGFDDRYSLSVDALERRGRNGPLVEDSVAALLTPFFFFGLVCRGDIINEATCFLPLSPCVFPTLLWSAITNRGDSRCLCKTGPISVKQKDRIFLITEDRKL